jgi:hypothetical protein
MAVCEVCGTRYLFRPLNRRLDIPEFRSMTGVWPWLAVRVCDACLDKYDREFIERLRLLAPDVLEKGEPIVEHVCMACGSVDPAAQWSEASRWVDAGGRNARRARFFLCGHHTRTAYAEGVVVASNLTDLRQMKLVLDELPAVGGPMLERIEHWRPDEAKGPAGALDFAIGRTRDDAAEHALEYWQASPEGLEARGAWLGPIRKDYRMRYRLELVRDMNDGRRETLVVVRLGNDRFATYRLERPAPPTARRASRPL